MKALFTFSLSLCLLLLSANTMMAQNRDANELSVKSERIDGNAVQSLIRKMTTAYNLNSSQQQTVNRVAVALGQRAAQGTISQNEFQADFKQKMRRVLSAANYTTFENDAAMNQAVNAIYIARKR